MKVLSSDTAIEGLEDYAINYADLRSDGTLVVREALPSADDSGPGLRQRIWTADIARPVINPVLRPTDEQVSNPVWVDDDRVVVTYDGGLAWLNVDRGGGPEPLSIPNPEGTLSVSGLTPERDKLLVNYGERGDDFSDTSQLRVGLVPVEPDDNGEYPIEPLFARESTDARIDPSGDYIIYTSADSGSRAIYIDAYPELNDRRPLSDADGGFDANWSPDGDSVFYLRNDGRLMKVTIERSPSLVISDPVVVADVEYFAGIAAVDPDYGVLMITSRGTGAVDQNEPDEREPATSGDLLIIQGFGEDLKRRVSAD